VEKHICSFTLVYQFNHHKQALFYRVRHRGILSIHIFKAAIRRS